MRADFSFPLILSLSKDRFSFGNCARSEVRCFDKLSMSGFVEDAQ